MFNILISIFLISTAKLLITLCGNKYQSNNSKKYVQSTLFFITVFLILETMGLMLFKENAWYALQASASISFILMVADALPFKYSGYIIVPVISAVMIYIFIENYDPVQLNYLSAGIVLGTLISLVSIKLRFLSSSGAAATVLLAAFIFGFGVWKWTLPMLMFFVVSSILSKVRSARNREVDIYFDKTGTRDYLQVFSNGGAGGILVLLNYFFNSDIYFIIYAASIASVCADTWGTEIGTMYRARTYNILNFREVEQGTSGAVSLPGTAGSIAGAFFIAFISVLWISFNIIPYFLVIFFSGTAGSIIDSILGAAFQGSYQCSICGKITEKTIHCTVPAKLKKGFSWLNNDVVNISAAVGGGIFSIIFLYIFL